MAVSSSLTSSNGFESGLTEQALAINDLILSKHRDERFPSLENGLAALTLEVAFFLHQFVDAML